MTSDLEHRADGGDQSSCREPRSALPNKLAGISPDAKTVATVLVVDDDPQECSVLSAMLQSLGYRVEIAVDGEEALAKIDVTPVAAILTDLMMPRMDGFQLLRTLMDRGELTPTIVLTGFDDISNAVSIVHELGAFWFLGKPAQLDVLEALLSRAISHGRLIKETEQLQRQLSHQGVLGDLVGSSDVMRRVYALIQQVAPTDASVLITGESGTGKELISRTIHRLSNRASGPFVAINCAALPAELIESELFGHEKGSFTGAVNRHPGCFEQAHNGTLLLDEIGEMPVAMQARLLRVLEESSVRRLGGTADIPVNARILAATNRDVAVALRNKTLREDLYYRLNVFHIQSPSLRERAEDIPALAKAIVETLNQKHDCSVKSLHPGTLERLMAYSWPGNVRELRNALEWAVITAQSAVLMPSHLPHTLSRRGASESKTSVNNGTSVQFETARPLDEVEREYIMATLKTVNNDRKRAAQALGISLRTLCSRLAESKREGLERAATAQ
jgi:DNA-binding NtrC family response regulator